MAQNHGGRLTYEHINCCVIVAHPDDETLWAGGTMLLHPDSCWTVTALCRGSDPDRAPKFHQALEHYGAKGVMGDIDDGPDQKPLGMVDVEDAILDVLPSDRYDLVLTHGLWGEYTSDRRHEKVAKAVMALRESGRLSVAEVWMFAYEDGGTKYLPRAMSDADVYIRLPHETWEEKHRIICDVYGHAAESFAARTTPKEEAFWVLGQGK
ncbi:MAG: PIG-L deacetylase family protein [Planctomycetota bacterium]|jgi:LmbE family N-acetylglucosaminyl deacetylase